MAARIVFEGADMMGKTTISKMLAAKFGVPWFREPSKFVVPDHDTTSQPLERFRQDRLEQESVILEQSKGKDLVVIDRGILSSVIYQRVSVADEVTWCRQTGIQLPDALVIMLASPSASAGRHVAGCAIDRGGTHDMRKASLQSFYDKNAAYWGALGAVREQLPDTLLVPVIFNVFPAPEVVLEAIHETVLRGLFVNKTGGSLPIQDSTIMFLV